KHFIHTPLLKACVKETLRLRPISIGVGRLATNDMVIAGYHIPKDTMIITQNQVACSLSEYFAQPNEYRPDRWIRSNRSREHRYLYIPFGHGTRMCLGRRIAELELYILLANLVDRFRLECVNPADEIGQRTRLVNVPDGPIRLRFVDRK
ncbi:hypothetical protein BLA29_002211, partial [Euroglyphus maynei]